MSVIKTCLAALAVLAIVVAEDTYPDTYDDINPDEILSNPEVRQQFYNCIMETGPCESEIQKFVKAHVVEAFVTKCKKCTEKQKKIFEKIVMWYAMNSKEDWDAAVKKILEDAKKMNITPVTK